MTDMGTAVGMRNEPIRCYERRTKSTDGTVNSAFYFVGEFWGRLDESRASVRIVAERLQLKLDALCEFADEVDVPDKGVLLDTTDGRAWWVRGINKVTLLRRVLVGVERVTEEQFRNMVLYDDPPGDATTHLIDRLPTEDSPAVDERPEV